MCHRDMWDDRVCCWVCLDDVGVVTRQEKKENSHTLSSGQRMSVSYMYSTGAFAFKGIRRNHWPKRVE